jgi:pimeloyl-ACP methyl ester carboxylesterase
MLHYIKIGTGAKVMVGFHGFGRDASMFQNYENVFPGYTIYSISLFYHGSHWQDQDAGLSDEKWKAMFGDFLDKESIQNFSLLGFSLGGKMALYTFQLYGHQVDALYLIAPYGIKANIVEWLTQKFPLVYQKLEKYVYQPAFLLSLLGVLRQYKLVNPTLVNITLKQMKSLDSRTRSYHSMRLYGTLRLNLKEIKAKLEKSGIPVTFYLGRFDSILTSEVLHKYTSSFMNFSLHVLPEGHGRLPDVVAQKFGRQPEMAYSFV